MKFTVEADANKAVTADETSRESEEYTAKEYRDILNALHDMDVCERERAFGVIKPAWRYVIDYPASELIEKYRAYVNTPKVGEYWKEKANGEMVVVRNVEKDLVHIYHCDGGFDNCYTLKNFVKNFIKTEHKSQYLESFIREMEEVSK